MARINEAEECIEGLNLKVEDYFFLWIFTIGFFKCKKCNNIAIEGLSLKVEDNNHGDDKFKNLNLENSDVKTKWFGTRFF